MLNVYKDLTFSISNSYIYLLIAIAIVDILLIVWLTVQRFRKSQSHIVKKVKLLTIILSVLTIISASCIVYLSNSNSHLKKLNESEYTLQVSNDHNYITLKNQANDKTFIKIEEDKHKLIANQLEILDESDGSYFVRAVDGQESITLTLNKNQYNIESN